ncbi:fatty acid-binding protein, heart-like [Cyprinodon tularosa]|uniref:fatty acid-binding protein, heart-like n=1 Tax=Cyprinodon tularosa TaxID=77115 RepID=UPI0018E22035|nr:fatty acid-binding protein, heart-like [Cyprinodon tularosa]
MVEQFVGTWKMTSSENFDELMKAFGMGASQRQTANQNRPKFTLSMDDQGMISMKSLNIFGTPEIQFKLNEPFVQKTINNKETKTVVTLENGKLIQKHSGDGGDFIIEREISDGQLIARSKRGNVEAVRTFEKEA